MLCIPISTNILSLKSISIEDDHILLIHSDLMVIPFALKISILLKAMKS